MTASADAGPAVAAAVAMTPAPAFEQADAGRDGTASRDEAVAAKALQNARLDSADQNKDGKLGKVEYDAAVKTPVQRGG